MPLPTYLMSNFPSVRPSLNLQFDSQPTPADMTSHLASVGATFSRASIGTYTDANGLIQEASAGQARPNYSTDGVHEGLLIEESRTNLVKTSEHLNEYVNTTFNTISVENQAIAPDGKASADKIIANSTDSVHVYLASQNSRTGTYVHSIFAKSGEYDYLFLKPFSGAVSASNNVVFNLSNGTVYDAGTYSEDYGIEDYGNGWYRCYVVVTNPDIQQFGISNLANASNDDLSFAGDGESGVLVWGYQEEEGSFPTSYIPTIPTFTSRASDGTYFDSSRVLQTASTDEERIDHKYIDGQWVEAGLLLEGASTNLFEYSEDFATGLSYDNVSVSTNQDVAPDGNTTADRVIEDGTLNRHRFYEVFSRTSGTTYTLSVYAKSSNRNTYLNAETSLNASAGFDLSAGTIDVNTGSASIEDVGNGWYRCSVTGTATVTGNGTFYIQNQVGTVDVSYTGDSSSYVSYWGAQLEEQSQVTSYIATSGGTATRSADVYTTATKQRSADVCYIDGTAFSDFYNQEEGTYFVKFNDVNDLSTSSYILNSDNGTNDERVYLLYGSGGTGNLDFRVQDDDSTAFSDNIGTIAEDTTYKTAIRIKAGDYRGILDGTDVSTDTYNATPSITNVSIGSRGSGSHINGKINKFIYFPRGLSNNELIKLTQ